mmetsp:Transcript_109588/g.338278  ORF Transcript_109588/g.338278 Transcript_109588/m.338278 type:complete len:217 (-) Transcript_109588:77-727(-)
MAVAVARHKAVFEEEVGAPRRLDRSGPASLGPCLCDGLQLGLFIEPSRSEGSLRLDVLLQRLGVVSDVPLLGVVQVGAQELPQHLEVPRHAAHALAVRQRASGVPHARAVRPPLLEVVQEVVGEQGVANAVAPQVLVVDPRRQELEARRSGGECLAELQRHVERKVRGSQAATRAPDEGRGLGEAQSNMPDGDVFAHVHVDVVDGMACDICQASLH